MSSEDIPRIPERPRKVRGPSLVTDFDSVGSSSPSPIGSGVAKAEGSESPRIPTRRPQRVKNSSSPSAVPVSRPNETASHTPPVPETRPSREKKQDSSAKGADPEVDDSKRIELGSDHDSAPRPPTTRPLRVKTTPAIPAMPSAKPLAKASTVANIEVTETPEEPSDRTVKRSTTENLDLLVQNTSDQLKEMELLLSKHETSSQRKSAQRSNDTLEVKPSDESASEVIEQTPADVSESPQTSSRENISLKPETEEQQVSSAVKDYGVQEIDKGEREQEPLQETESKQITPPEYSGEQLVTKVADEDGLKETQEKESSSDKAELAASVEHPVETAAADLSEEEEKAVDTLEDVLSTQEPDRPFSDQVDEEVEKDSVSPVSNDVESEPTETVKVQSPKTPGPELEKSAEAQAAKGIDVKSENSVEAQPSQELDAEETPESPLTKTDVPKAETVRISEPGPTELQKSDSVHPSKPEDSTIPATKRGPPPVPKKPSSRIAAFQQMLQKQQLEQLQGSGPFKSHEASPSTDSSTDTAPTPNRTALSGDRAQFGKNLGALFANPAMLPGGIPSKREPPAPKTSEAEPAETSQGKSTETRQRRARGPRGRKLPSQLANVEQVKTESCNEIEIFHTWKLVFTKNNREQADKVLEEEPGQKSVQLLERPGDDEVLGDGTQERRPSVLEDPDQPMIGLQQTLDDNNGKLLKQDLEELVSKSGSSVTNESREGSNPEEEEVEEKSTFSNTEPTLDSDKQTEGADGDTEDQEALEPIAELDPSSQSASDLI